MNCARRAGLATLAVICALALAPGVARAADPVEHRLSGTAARALTVAFQTIGASPANAEGASRFSGLTVHVADLPACYRFRFVSNADPTVKSILRFAKPASQGGTGKCGDDEVTETAIPGREAEAMVRLVQAWSRNALSGAPGVETLSTGAFELIERAPSDGPIVLDLKANDSTCPYVFTYAPADGKLTALPHAC
jgi:hypothetical protein